MSALGLYDLRNRFMSPELGRFLQADPIGIQIQGAKPSAQAAAYFWAGQAPAKFASTELNLYRYCRNDPANLMDPLGLDPMVVDQETDALAHKALTLNLGAMQAMQRLGGLFSRYEFSTTVVQAPEGKRLVGPRTDKNETQVEPPSEEGTTSLAETHNHTFDLSPAGNKYTKVNFSRDDINRGDKYGRPQYAITPNGVRERYRPSDKATDEERKKEGGIIERWRDGEWKRVPGANTDMSNYGAHRNGY